MPIESVRGGEGKWQVVCTKGVGQRKVACSHRSPGSTLYNKTDWRTQFKYLLKVPQWHPTHPLKEHVPLCHLQKNFLLKGNFFGLSNCEIIKKQNLFYHIISVQMLKLLEACLKTWSRQTPYRLCIRWTYVQLFNRLVNKIYTGFAPFRVHPVCVWPQ